ncbi:glutamyl-tRNA synthetase [Spiroplasma sabaudiense Ar-1343]|uniref:Glutamate--tRNA ligase n=1 Tax=Spiroplasma sabaudiense Ar-1343 TaxID=1276257 RepID=W6AKJ0_9MOLU|nr:glutamate--tRNA ligase [Spiroplasma sabaudiense]AHI54224.1 glutamyl-tRNA synthetase [Spiroplasma sabaudiense Ar-1343]
MKNIRLRYAPSPTGFLHIGNTRTALMNYLFAKHYDGSFIVRIEDTDLERNVEGAIESQFENMNWLGIIPDESFLKPKSEFGKYKQSEKFERYEKIANDLIKEKLAYKCFCTTEELEANRELQISKGIPAPKYNKKCLNLSDSEIKNLEKQNLKPNIRFLVPENRDYKTIDLVRNEVVFNSKEIGDFVILKSNKIATYNFAVVIDDIDMKITHVVRGEEHISNTPRQLMIYEALKETPPTFCHLTLIVDETHKKLSKRSGNEMFFISQYKSQGYLPEALFNYIGLLGWSPSGEEEIFSKEEFIKIFDEKRFSKSPSTFDVNKLKWINSQYMKKMPDLDYTIFIKDFVDQSKFDFKKYSEHDFNQILLLFKKEIGFGVEINEHLQLFFNPNSIIDEKSKLTLKEFSTINVLKKHVTSELEKIEDWTEDNIKMVIKNTGLALNLKGKDLFMPIRILTTCFEHGPELAKTILLLGREQVIKNINL